MISQSLAGGPSADMRTDDWMFYYADIFVESVQYGGRTQLCKTLESLKDAKKTQEEIVKAMIPYGAEQGVSAPDYDSLAIANTTVDVNSSARPWTYQYCTEYGWF